MRPRGTLCGPRPWLPCCLRCWLSPCFDEACTTMNVSAQVATATWDTVVNLQGVSKTFRQRQRSGRLADVWRDLWRPTWREVRALQDRNLTIQRGEIVTYAGPNGAGKSTTIKLLAALLAPDAGTVRVLGYDPCRSGNAMSATLGASSVNAPNCGGTIPWPR